jgi:hypothetical protein
VEGTWWPQIPGGEHHLSLMVKVSLEAKVEILRQELRDAIMTVDPPGSEELQEDI